ncbi:hypothetical protein [Streptomyces sp. NBC_01296]|uniref:hypothetical protein n=1 Tax=Streptomyces sp. NBC_01296 TaxID=2903816 RepID=UPI002E1580E0|nr:hypothetical protein OG299_42095 [Streptomyces sp. NBC_01296]
MAWKKKPLVFGAAFIFLLTGCESGADSDAEPTSTGVQVTALSELEAISVADDPLADAESASSGTLKILAELRDGQDRIIMFANGDSCGIQVDAKGDQKANRIHLVSKWPAGGEGSNIYPAGPYNSASGSGPQKWVSLLCSKNAMVIEYASDKSEAPVNPRGHVTVTQVSDRPVTSRIIVGERKVREQIADGAKAQGTPNASPPPR